MERSTTTFNKGLLKNFVFKFVFRLPFYLFQSHSGAELVELPEETGFSTLKPIK